jgi:YHS domain-containing protein
MTTRFNRLFRFGIPAFPVILLCLLAPQGALAVEPLNRDPSGVALKGYDPVAYFMEGKPVKGKKEHQHEWMGAKWYFSTAANRDLFAEAPERYAPQYGGYCAYAVSRGYTADISPDQWKIVEDKLYLNNGWLATKLWKRNIPENIRKADENWPKIVNP